MQDSLLSYSAMIGHLFLLADNNLLLGWSPFCLFLYLCKDSSLFSATDHYKSCCNIHAQMDVGADLLAYVVNTKDDC